MPRSFKRENRWWTGCWLRLLLALVAFDVVPALRAMDAASDEALAHLAELIVPKGVLTAEENQTRPRKIVYWLWVACGRDLSPESALTLAARRAGCSLKT